MMASKARLSCGTRIAFYRARVHKWRIAVTRVHGREQGMPLQTAIRNKGAAVAAPRKNRTRRRRAGLQKAAATGKVLPVSLPSEAVISLLLDLYSRFTRKGR
jgi:hypothetical protein